MSGPLLTDSPFAAISTNSAAQIAGFAVLFGGNVINLFLYGVLTVQLYLYYISFPQDPWLLKMIVYLIYLTETGHSIILICDFGSNLTFGDFGANSITITTYIVSIYGGNPSISLVVVPVCGGIVAFLTQATYIYRLRILSQLRYISWSMMALIMANFVIFITLASLMAAAYASPISFDSVTFYIVGFQVWTSVSLVIDTTIAGIMIWSLTKNKILSKQLKSKVIHLVYLIIGTGALTAATNLITLILFALDSSIALGPSIVLPKLYANSMMVFLNDRILYGNDGDGQAISLEIMTGALGSMNVGTLPGPADAVQEQQILEGCNEPCQG